MFAKYMDPVTIWFFIALSTACPVGHAQESVTTLLIHESKVLHDPNPGLLHATGHQEDRFEICRSWQRLVKKTLKVRLPNESVDVSEVQLRWCNYTPASENHVPAQVISFLEFTRIWKDIFYHFLVFAIYTQTIPDIL